MAAGATFLRGETFVGIVTGHHDGDTFTIKVKTGKTAKDVKIRLAAADAPELRQKGGQNAVQVLAARAPFGTSLTCEKVSNSYDRIVARCSLSASPHDPRADLTRYMLQNGAALYWSREREHSADWIHWRPSKPGKLARASTRAKYDEVIRLLDLETHAQNAGLGIWHEDAHGEPPCPAWQFRHGGCR